MRTVHATYLGLEMQMHLEYQTSALVSLILSSDVPARLGLKAAG